ncbi:MAG: GNAT family N-acetyltransferase [Myxococcales bacterium]|nr:GNAT family N-acetyltransferase [Myxococcales bacterium]
MSAAAPFAVLDDGVRIARTGPQHAGALEALQHLVFPTLVDVERFKAPHYLRHIELFPEGQFVALDGERVVGMTSTLRLDFDFAHVDHTFADVIAGGWLTSHQPAGAWLYGADIGVHPDWRGHGIARALYAARQDVVRRLGLAGQVTVGMLSGFGAVMGRLDIASYYAAVCAGTLADPTVSAQLHVGFEARGLLRGYLHDPVCDGCGALLVLPADRDIPIRRQK